MKGQKLFLLLFFLSFAGRSFSQGFMVTEPVLEFDGRQLTIMYDVISKDQADQFFVWVEIEKENGELIHIKSLEGDVGENIKEGSKKQIKWTPEADNIFLDEDIFVEVKAERYLKSFNKGSAILMSTALPGLGQTKIRNGKPWWLGGLVAYGAMSGGLAVHTGYIKTYDSYRIEEDPSKRADLLNKAQQQVNLSGVLIVSGAAIWAANIIWMAMTPNNFKPLQNVNLSLGHPSGPMKGTAFLSLKINF